MARGDDPKKYGQGTYEYTQSHMPVREQSKVVGHAVRAMYLYTAMADLAAEIDDEGLKQACETLWNDVMSKRMYVTAGLGPAASNEGFTTDYDLPNDTAYAETCASVALVFWAQRMLNLDLDCTVRRRDGARRSSTAGSPASAGTARITSTRTRSRATARTSAGRGTPARAAR